MAATEPTTAAKGNLPPEYRVERFPFNRGERLSTLLRALAGRISPMAALRDGFIQRAGKAEPIRVNMEALLYRYDAGKDIALEAGDRVIIPFGAFEAFVTGEVKKSAFISVSGQSRLSALVGPFFTPYSSLRDVQVQSPEGDRASYDLFRAERNGDLRQDPYLKPGDRVIVNTLDRSVSIQGAVKRPGTYQLLPGEGLHDLIEVYALGFAESADSSKIDLVRIVGGSDRSGERMLIDYSTAGKLGLANKDRLNVPTLQSLLPIVFFEGAITVGASNATAKAEPGISNRLTYQFFQGELLSSAIQANRTHFAPEADLEKGYVIRAGVRRPVDFSRFLYDRDSHDSSILQPGDTIVIPFKQYFVSVGGAVMLPGRYPFVPDRGWRYYVGIAGGANQELNAGDARRISDVQGKPKGPNQAIEPEDSIVLESNSFLYLLGRVSTILTTVVSLASLFFTVKSFFP